MPHDLKQHHKIQRALKRLAKASGLKINRIFDGNTLSKLNKKSGRITYWKIEDALAVVDKIETQTRHIQSLTSRTEQELLEIRYDNNQTTNQ